MRANEKFDVHMPYVAYEMIGLVRQLKAFSGFPRRITVGQLTLPTEADNAEEDSWREAGVFQLSSIQGRRKVALWYPEQGYARIIVREEDYNGALSPVVVELEFHRPGKGKFRMTGNEVFSASRFPESEAAKRFTAWRMEGAPVMPAPSERTAVKRVRPQIDSGGDEYVEIGE